MCFYHLAKAKVPKDDSSIAIIFKKYYRELCFLSWQYVADPKEAEDIVQDIFVRIIAEDKEQHIEDIRSYLRIAVRNESLKKIQYNKKKRPFDKALMEISDSVEDDLISLEQHTLLFKFVEALPEERRKIFLLCVLDGLKYHEAATKLQISINTVKTQMKKAYKSLRESLDGFHL